MNKSGILKSSVFIYMTIIIIILLSLSSCISFVEVDIKKMDYRNDEQPIRSVFPDIPEYSVCYWKSAPFFRLQIGQAYYWVKGFIVLEEADFTGILSEYSWESIDIEFPEGMDPKITGFNDFNWCYNKNFKENLMTVYYGGDIFLDINNGIIYFAVVNN